MSKIGIIGVGHVGADVAYTLCREKLASHLVLIDELNQKVEAEKLELEDSLVIWDYAIKIETQNYESLKDADFIVISVGSQSIDNENRNSELLDNVQAVQTSIPRVLASGFSGIFIVISNPCDTITRLVQEISGFSRHRVIGTGTLLDTSRMKRVLSSYLDSSPRDINGYVLGEHGESQFIPWSQVRVGEKQVLKDRLLTLKEQDMLKEETRLGGWKIHSGKGWTSYGIASMCARLIQGIQLDEGRIFPLSVYDPKEKLYLGYPARVGRDGVMERMTLTLTPEEEKSYQLSAEEVRKTFGTIQ